MELEKDTPTVPTICLVGLNRLGKRNVFQWATISIENFKSWAFLEQLNILYKEL